MSRERKVGRAQDTAVHSEENAESARAKRSAHRKPRDVDKQSGNRAAEKRARDLMAIVNSQIKTAEASTAGANASTIGTQKLSAMTQLLIVSNGELMEAIVSLPSGSDLQLKAFAVGERAVAVIDRLESLKRSHAARAATQDEAAQGDATELFDGAAKRVPLGYCDRASTPQGQAPCELDTVKRDNYREAVQHWATTVHINWSAAVGAVLLDEKTRPKSVTFEQKLGEVLLGLVFNLLTYGAGKVVKLGFDAASKGAHNRARWEDGVLQPGGKADISDLELLKKGADMAVEKGAGLAKGKLEEGTSDSSREDGTLSMEALATRATAVAASFPADRAGFVATLKDVPSQWASNIHSNLRYLLDADLAALVVRLPGEEHTSQNAFERKIHSQLNRFDQQVKAVNRTTRPVKIVAPGGKLRHALVTREKKADSTLHGEWRGEIVQTGKWHFIRWIDEDLAGMAVHEAMNTGTIHDETAAMFTAWANDAAFWNEESLAMLSEWTASKQGAR